MGIFIWYFKFICVPSHSHYAQLATSFVKHIILVFHSFILIFIIEISLLLAHNRASFFSNKDVAGSSSSKADAIDVDHDMAEKISIRKATENSVPRYEFFLSTPAHTYHTPSQGA